MTPEEAVTLREYIDQRLSYLERSFRDHDQRNRQELDELRHSLEALRLSMLTTTEYDRRHDSLVRELTELQKWRANLSGRMVGLAVIGSIFVAVVAAVVTHLVGG